MSIVYSYSNNPLLEPPTHCNECSKCLNRLSTHETPKYGTAAETVLVAENTAFRVHGSLVARQSDLLERILDYFLSVPQVTDRSRRKKAKAESLRSLTVFRSSLL